MKTRWLWLVLALLAAAGLAMLVACSGDDDDDDDSGDDDTWDDFPIVFSGTMNYDGDATGERIMVAISDNIAGAPLWFGYVEIPESGFPFEYRLGVDQPFVGDYYVLALIDVDATDGYMPNFDLDPLDIPEATSNIVEGENTFDFTFVDPDLTDDDTSDDDSSDDDTTPDDDTADDDTAGDETGIEGTLRYTGTAGGTTVVFGFFTGVPMGPPAYSAEVEVPESNGFPFDYRIETEFTGSFRVVAFLDVDPNDGDSINLALDPTNWGLSLPFTDIVDGQMTKLDITLQDP